MGNKEFYELLANEFGEDKDVYEVVLYCVSSLNVSSVIASSIAMDKDGVELSAFDIKQMRLYDAGTINNPFYHANFAVIKAALAVAEAKLSSMGYLYQYYKQHGEKDEDKLRHVQAILLTQLDVLTFVALTWKGLEFAEKFDFKMRCAFGLRAEQENWFNAKRNNN